MDIKRLSTNYITNIDIVFSRNRLEIYMGQGNHGQKNFTYSAIKHWLYIFPIGNDVAIKAN